MIDRTHGDATRAGALIGSLLVVGFCCAAEVGAQERGGGDSATERSARPDTVPAAVPESARYDLEELVVTANRVPTAVGRVPSRVDVIRGSELRARGIHFLSDALRDVAGTSFSSQGPFGALTSLFMRGGESDYVQVLVDGVPVNDPGGSFDFADLTTDDVARVEILRGPGSVLYGSDAMTGVIQIFTRDGQGPANAQSGVRGGTYGSFVFDAGVSGGDRDAAYSVEISRFDSDGLRAFNNEYRNSTASGRFRVAPDERTEAVLNLRYTDSRYRFPTDGAGRLVDENQFQERDAGVLGLELRRRLAPWLTGEVRLSTQSTNTAFEDEQDGPADTTGTFASQNQRDLDQHRGELLLRARPDDATELVVGGTLEEAEERSSSRFASPFGSSASSSDHDRSNLGLYLQAVRDLAGRASLTAGVRVDDNQEFGLHETYRLGAAVRATPTTRIRGTYGTGFKAPTFFENFAEGFVTGNPDLEPETSESWEVGVDQEIAAAGVELSATYFDQTFEDMIQFTFAPPEEGDPNYFNVAAADARGVELEATFRGIAPVEVSGNYSYLETEVTDSGFDEGEDASFVEGRRLLRRPTHAASLRVGGRFLERGRLSGTLRWVGDRADRDFGVSPARRVELDPYLTVDLSARFVVVPAAAGRPEIAPTLSVENLLDEAYQEVVGFPARGRTILAGVQVDLGI